MDSVPLFFYDSRLNGLDTSGPAVCSFPWWVALGLRGARKKKSYKSRVHLPQPGKQTADSRMAFPVFCVTSQQASTLFQN